MMEPPVELRTINVGCFGGGTGLPSLLGGLKRNPWLTVNAVVTMFDSGGSSGQLRDQLGVLPPGDVLKCALALARNEREARRVLLSRLPMLQDTRLGGHTGGNLLLSMMEQYSGDFLAAVEGLRALLGCAGRVWPVSVESASLCAEYGDGTHTRFPADAVSESERTSTTSARARCFGRRCRTYLPAGPRRPGCRTTSGPVPRRPEWWSARGRWRNSRCRGSYTESRPW